MIQKLPYGRIWLNLQKASAYELVCPRGFVLIAERKYDVKRTNRQDGIFISIVVPAYNEETHIAATVRSIDQYLSARGWPSEIVLVDDGSSDRTIAEVERSARKSRSPVRVLKNRLNRGKGYSVRRGVMASRGDFVLFSDADLSTPIRELDRLLQEARRGYDVVIGSRGLTSSRIEVHQPLYREWMGKTFNLILRSLGLSHLRDTQCGFKLFSRRAAETIFPSAKINRFAFDVEILLIAQRLGLKIKELPVHWRDSLPSKVTLLRDSTRMFFDVLTLRLTRRPSRRLRDRLILSDET